MQKLTLLLASGLLSAAFIWLPVRGQESTPDQIPTASDSTKDSVLGVDEYMTHLEQFTGVRTIEGVISSRFVEKKMLLLVDLAEVRNCGSTECARLSLPVSWEGVIPPVGETIQVKGSAQMVAGKRLFVATGITTAGAKEATVDRTK